MDIYDAIREVLDGADDLTFGYTLVRTEALAALRARYEADLDAMDAAASAEEARTERLAAAGGWEWAVGGPVR